MSDDEIMRHQWHSSIVGRMKHFVLRGLSKKVILWLSSVDDDE